MFGSSFGKSNPTRNWPGYAGKQLEVDLRQGRLNDVQLGQPLSAVSFLGPDEGGKSYRDGELCYYSLGLCVGFAGSDPKCSDFSFISHDPDDDRFRRFPGLMVFDGQRIDLASLTAENCEDHLGPCYWRDEDSGETILFYEWPSNEWQIEFDGEGLTRWLITDDPLMARADQREAYGVTKPWPPGC